MLTPLEGRLRIIRSFEKNPEEYITPINDMLAETIMTTANFVFFNELVFTRIS